MPFVFIVDVYDFIKNMNFPSPLFAMLDSYSYLCSGSISEYVSMLNIYERDNKRWQTHKVVLSFLSFLSKKYIYSLRLDRCMALIAFFCGYLPVNVDASCFIAYLYVPFFLHLSAFSFVSIVLLLRLLWLLVSPIGWVVEIELHIWDNSGKMALKL